MKRTAVILAILTVFAISIPVIVSAAGTVSTDISVNLQGTRTDNTSVVPLTVKFFAPGADVMAGEALFTFTGETVCFGGLPPTVNVEVEAGTYDVTVVSEHTLTNVKRGVVISQPSAVSMGVLVEGDVNGNGIVNILDISAMIPSYGKMAGDPAYNRMVDLDRNGGVSILDLSLIVSNYLKYSPIVVP